MILGCHCGMSGTEMMLGSVKEALSYGANALMIYTGAPQNTIRKQLKELLFEDLRIDKEQFDNLDKEAMISICDDYKKKNLKYLKEMLLEEINNE